MLALHILHLNVCNTSRSFLSHPQVCFPNFVPRCQCQLDIPMSMSMPIRYACAYVHLVNLSVRLSVECRVTCPTHTNKHTHTHTQTHTCTQARTHSTHEQQLCIFLPTRLSFEVIYIYIYIYTHNCHVSNCWAILVALDIQANFHTRAGYSIHSYK